MYQHPIVKDSVSCVHMTVWLVGFTVFNAIFNNISVISYIYIYSGQF